LKILSVTPGLFNEQHFKDGVLIPCNKATRQEGIQRIKTAMQMNEELSNANEGGLLPT